MIWPGFEFRVALRFCAKGACRPCSSSWRGRGRGRHCYISALISGLQANTLVKTLGAQARTLRAPDDLVTPAAPVLPDAAALTETQPRAQRLRSVANWQALVPLLEGLPPLPAFHPWCPASA